MKIFMTALHFSLTLISNPYPLSLTNAAKTSQSSAVEAIETNPDFIVF